VTAAHCNKISFYALIGVWMENGEGRGEKRGFHYYFYLIKNLIEG
jgi:hypothetical protein